jgi:hypothetical protein
MRFVCGGQPAPAAVVSRWAGMAALAALVVLSVALIGAPRATAAVSSPSWVPVNSQSRPPARDLAVAAYDPATRQFVLFGGNDSQFNAANDTWLWEGLSWMDATKLGTNPAPRYQASIAYDGASSQLILVGGTNQNNDYFNDTWTWNGSNWVQLHPATSAPLIAGAAMAYDPATRQIVMFGGEDGKAFSNSTWVWTGTNWPSARVGQPVPRRDADADEQFNGDVHLTSR